MDSVPLGAGRSSLPTEAGYKLISFPPPSNARTVRWDLSTTTFATFASDGFLATFGTMILVPAVSSGAFGLSRVNKPGSMRSEERRVGKEGRTRWARCDDKEQ